MTDLGDLIFRTCDDEGEIHVYQNACCRYLTFGNHVEQSCIELAVPARLAYVYTQAMMLALLLHPAPRRALLLGVGGGSLVRALRAADRALHVIGVERRAAVIDAAHAYFGLPDDRQVRIVCDDADRFLAACDQQFDLLFADLYMADGMCPRQVAPDFLLHCRSRLAGNGVLVVNQWSSEFAGNRAALVALNEVFDGRVVNLHAQGGNILSFAFHDALPDLHRDAWFDAAQALGLKLSIPLQRHARNLWRQNAEVLRSGRFRRLPR